VEEEMQNKGPVFQNSKSDGGTFLCEGRTGNTTAILLFHGFTATTVEVRPMAKFLHEQGFTVSGPLLPGHGVSPNELNHTNFKDWIAAAENAYLDLHHNYPHVIVLGESMGALLALWLGSIHPEIDGILVFAPALNIHHLWQSTLFWPFVKFMNKKNIDLNSPWQGFNVIPVHAASELFHFQRKVRLLLSKINTPTLVFQGKLDKTINPIGAVEVMEGIASIKKELVWLEDSAHCILLDKQMDIVEKLTLAFIRENT
jgi:carboxylesterase